jgi:hypothetical protein
MSAPEGFDYEECCVAIDGSHIWRNGLEYRPVPASPPLDKCEACNTEEPVSGLVPTEPQEAEQ